MWLSIIKNPLTKMVAGKVVDHFKHKAEKVKTIREAEIQACKEVDVQRIKSQDKSWKDEILMVWLIAMLSTGWFESTRDNFEEWVRIINDLPDSVWYLVIAYIMRDLPDPVGDINSLLFFCNASNTPSI